MFEVSRLLSILFRRLEIILASLFGCIFLIAVGGTALAGFALISFGLSVNKVMSLTDRSVLGPAVYRFG